MPIVPILSAAQARKQRRAARLQPAMRAATACAFPSCQILRSLLKLETLAQKIAGNGSPELVELARKIAEAEIDVIRVRRARTDLISRVDFGLRDQTSVDPGFSDKLADAMHNRARKIAQTSKSAPLDLRDLFREPFIELDRSMEGLEFLTRPPHIGPEFAIIDRYERRALSRRKFAIRAFDAARAALASTAA